MQTATPPPPRRDSRRGPAFTLMELLVTVGILAVLAGIAVPATDRVLHKARSAQCMSNLRNLGAALQSYLAENNNIMPTLVTARPSKDDEDLAAIDNTLNEHVSSPDVFRCPADHQHFYEKTGTSYTWNNLLNGQSASSLLMMGFIKEGNRIPVMGDKEGFHKFRDVKVNILYADGHVAKEIKFVVDE